MFALLSLAPVLVIATFLSTWSSGWWFGGHCANDLRIEIMNNELRFPPQTLPPEDRENPKNVTMNTHGDCTRPDQVLPAGHEYVVPYERMAAAAECECYRCES